MDTFFRKHEQGTLRLLICGATEKCLLMLLQQWIDGTDRQTLYSYIHPAAYYASTVNTHNNKHIRFQDHYQVVAALSPFAELLYNRSFGHTGGWFYRLDASNVTQPR